MLGVALITPPQFCFNSVVFSSNTQGIENPGYETTPTFQGMPEAKTRPPLSYVAQRQPSESGRHLLSDPSTPLSPPGPGDVFFPSLGEWHLVLQHSAKC